MKREEIEFFKGRLVLFCDETIEKLMEDKKEAELRVDKTIIKSINLTPKGVKIIKSILRLGLKIIFMNRISNNVVDSDFISETNDLLNVGTIGDKSSITSECYEFRKRALEYVISLLVELRVLLENDDNVVKFANKMYFTLDVSDWNEYSDYITTLLFLHNSGLTNKKQFARAACVDNLHKAFPGYVKKYFLNYKALDFFKETFTEYENLFGKKYKETVVKR